MRTILAVALTISALACNKKNEAAPTDKSTKDEPKPAPKVTGEAKPATPAVSPTVSSSESKPTTAECPPGAWSNAPKDHPTFCISLPKELALKEGGPEKRSHHEWSYTFTGPGDYRPSLSVSVQGIAKPGVASGMSAYGPDADMKKIVDEDVPNGKRVVARPADYDKEEYANEDETVVLSKGEAVDVSKECGSCPAWEWIVKCHSSVAKKATAEDRNACRSIRMP